MVEVVVKSQHSGVRQTGWWGQGRNQVIFSEGQNYCNLYLTTGGGWECGPTTFCISDVTWRCGIQKIRLKHGCDFADVLVAVARRFALLVTSLQWNRKIQRGNTCRRKLTLFEVFGVVFLFIWCGNAVPTPLVLALHSPC